jgi:hypothetical protein
MAPRQHYQRKPEVKYKDMKSYRIKIAYNSMGEQIKEKIHITKPMKNPKAKSSKGILANANATMNEKTSARKLSSELCSSASNTDVARTVNVLREILLGKITRDLRNKGERQAFELSDVLRFYCDTSFGARMVADEKKTDLFNAILALQSFSPFLRTMKRLLLIPGIRSFSDELSALYTDIWTFLVGNDIPSVGNGIKEMQSSCTINNILVQLTDLWNCLEYLRCTEGHCLSPYLLQEIRHQLEQLPINTTPSSIAVSEGNGWVDADEALEILMNVVERRDKRAMVLNDKLFGSGVLKNRVLIPRSMKVSPEDCDSFVKNSTFDAYSLNQIKLLLDEFVIHDSQRQGLIPSRQFVVIVTTWYSTNNNNFDLDVDELCSVLSRFQVKGSKKFSDYIDFFGFLYTIVLETFIIPDIAKLLQMISRFRGVEASDNENIEQYVALSRYICQHTAHSPQAKKTKFVDQSNMSIKKIHKKRMSSNFISKWISTRIDRNKDRERRYIYQAKDNGSIKRRDTERPKTPIHHKEQFWDERIICQGYPRADKSASRRTSHKEPLVHETAHLPRISNIHVRFPFVEPLRSEVGLLHKGEALKEGSTRAEIKNCVNKDFKSRITSTTQQSFASSLHQSVTKESESFMSRNELSEPILYEDDIGNIRVNLALNDAKRNKSGLDDQFINHNQMIKLPSLRSQHLVPYVCSTSEVTALVSKCRGKLPNKIAEKWPHATVLLASADNMRNETLRKYLEWKKYFYQFIFFRSTDLYCQYLNSSHMNRSWFIPLGSLSRCFNANENIVKAYTVRNQRAIKVMDREPRRKSVLKVQKGTISKDCFLDVKLFAKQQVAISSNNNPYETEGIRNISTTGLDINSELSRSPLTEDLLSLSAEIGSATLKLRLVRVNVTQWGFLFQGIESLVLQLRPQICLSLKSKNSSDIIQQQTISTKLNLFEEEQTNENDPKKVCENRIQKAREKVGIKRLLSISHGRTRTTLPKYHNLNYQDFLPPREKCRRIRPVRYTIR